MIDRRAMIVAGLAFSVACRSRARSSLAVFSAVSLREPILRIGAALEARHGEKVTATFDASSRLAHLIEQGAPADVFVSADEAWMDHLAGRGLVDASTRRNLATNELVVVVPSGAPLPIRSLHELARPEVRHLALAGESVPAGRYARAALDAAGVYASLEPRVVRGDNVRVALAWVAQGEADAAIVYRTDAAIEPRVRVAFAIPTSSHPPIVAPAAVVARSGRRAAAERLVLFAASEEGRAIFREAGFGVP